MRLWRGQWHPVFNVPLLMLILAGSPLLLWSAGVIGTAQTIDLGQLTFLALYLAVPIWAAFTAHLTLREGQRSGLHATLQSTPLGWERHFDTQLWLGTSAVALLSLMAFGAWFAFLLRFAHDVVLLSALVTVAWGSTVAGFHLSARIVRGGVSDPLAPPRLRRVFLAAGIILAADLAVVGVFVKPMLFFLEVIESGLGPLRPAPVDRD